MQKNKHRLVVQNANKMNNRSPDLCQGGPGPPHPQHILSRAPAFLFMAYQEVFILHGAWPFWAL